MPALRTEITEIVTGLGTLGDDDVDAVLGPRTPPVELRNVDDATWSRLRAAHHDGTHRADILAAWNNGRALFQAEDGLRGRRPAVIEWKGGHRDPGDESVPADLRIDHVYLVSCKYLSRVLHNASPAAVFDRLLVGTPTRRSDDGWFDVVAPAEHQNLYQQVRRSYGSGANGSDVAGGTEGTELPEQVRALDRDQRAWLREHLPREWDQQCAAAYQALVDATAERTAERWRTALADGTGRDRNLLWRLLRLGSAPYFVLGTGPRSSLRLRMATPWDWNQEYELRRFQIEAQSGGQARVGWRARIRSRPDRGGDPAECDVVGHVEIRWSHGRFGGHPEAKVYLDTPHARVPGYFPLV